VVKEEVIQMEGQIILEALAGLILFLGAFSYAVAKYKAKKIAEQAKAKFPAVELSTVPVTEEGHEKAIKE
jgi:hypothetical protein